MSKPLSPRLTKVAEADFPTEFGVFRIFGFEAPAGNGTEEAVVLKMGDFTDGAPPLVRIHSQCLTGDVFHSLRCDCRAQLEIATAEHRAGRPGAADLRTPGRPRHRAAQQTARLRIAGPGRGHGGSQRATWVRQRPAELQTARRRFCSYFGLKAVRLMSNNPEKVEAVEKAGVQVAERVPCLADVVDTRRRLSAHQAGKDGAPAGIRRSVGGGEGRRAGEAWASKTKAY